MTDNIQPGTFVYVDGHTCKVTSRYGSLVRCRPVVNDGKVGVEWFHVDRVFNALPHGPLWNTVSTTPIMEVDWRELRAMPLEQAQRSTVQYHWISCVPGEHMVRYEGKRYGVLALKVWHVGKYTDIAVEIDIDDHTETICVKDLEWIK